MSDQPRPTPAPLTNKQIEFCAEDGEWGGPCCPFCSASPEGQHKPDCAWAKSQWTRERIAFGILKLASRPAVAAQDVPSVGCEVIRAGDPLVRVSLTDPPSPTPAGDKD